MALEPQPNRVHEAVDSFVDAYNPLAVSRHLRLVLITALKNERFIEEGDFDEIIRNLEGLFDLLDWLTDKSVYDKE